MAYGVRTPQVQSMPPLPSGLIEWLPSGLVTGVFGWLLYEVKAGEARQAKRIDEFRADLKASEARQVKRSEELRADMKELRAEQRASEARQREDMADLKTDVRALGEKLDRLVESLLAAKQL